MQPPDTSAAMVAAQVTDGSKRVTTTNTARLARPSAARAGGSDPGA